MNQRNCNGFATTDANVAEFFWATVFGRISQNTRSSSVKTQVTIHKLELQNCSVAHSAEYIPINILITLFQINIVINNLFGLLFNNSTVLLAKRLFFTIVLTCAGDNETSAVSAQEKNDERIIKKNININVVGSIN